ncbi:L,D-transpeptidase [Salaquimonas pukyongi]|uniref:L,D-transpeptidase n=1 Tax=Salaquimonas pukyongi TaxID=2712698 RepID=UPI00096BB6E6|nr:L,D-transpeptidase [Salaquimonas pukyongi]
MNRRGFVLGGVAAGLGGAATGILSVAFPDGAAAAQSKKRVKVDPKYAPQIVAYPNRHKRGTIVIDTRKRFLYLVLSPVAARRYGVGVGRDALAWSGTATIDAKKEWPSWRPTDEMIAREPGKYAKYRNGMPGGPNNPLGARALYLFDNGYDTFYRIHGTTAPHTIGRAVSNGCIRMINDHVIDLYKRVPLGTKVVVL